MASPLDARQLTHETVPAAALLLFWAGLSAFPHHIIATGVRYAGVVMVLLYVIIRGIQLAGTLSPTPQPNDLAGLLRENGQVALFAGVWFLAAFLVSATRSLWRILSVMGTPYPRVLDMLTSFLLGSVELLVFTFTWTGVATVLLYAIAVGLSRSRRQIAGSGNIGDTDSQAGD